jgi:hypothetical protein
MKYLEWAVFAGDQIVRGPNPPTRAALEGRRIKAISLNDGQTIRALAVAGSRGTYITIEDQAHLLSGPPCAIRCKVRVRQTAGGEKKVIQQIIDSDLATVTYDCASDTVHIQVKERKP